jgi:hypothetical protein
MPWIGGPAGPSTRTPSAKWRATFIESITNLLTDHPGFAGVQINIEPLTSGDKDFLRLLEEIHAALPKGKLLSVAAYPPPTRWQRKLFSRGRAPKRSTGSDDVRHRCACAKDL